MLEKSSRVTNWQQSKNNPVISLALIRYWVVFADVLNLLHLH